MKKLRSVLALLMVAAMMLSFSVVALAAEDEEAVEAAEEVVEEVAEEVAEAPADVDVAFDGAVNLFDLGVDFVEVFPEDVLEDGAYYRRDKTGKYTIEIGTTWDEVEEDIADGTIDCTSGNLAFIYPDQDEEMVSVTIYQSDIEKILNAKDPAETLHVWIVNEDTDEDGWVYPENSCTEGGVATRECERCGLVETKQIKPAGHQWASESDNDQWGEIVEPATCTESGLAQDYCLICGAMGEKTRVIEPLGHEYFVVIDKYPTCVEDSYYGDGEGGDYELDYELTDVEFHMACARCGAAETTKGNDGKERNTKYSMSAEDFLDLVEDWVEENKYWYAGPTYYIPELDVRVVVFGYGTVGVQEISGKDPKDAEVEFVMLEDDAVAMANDIMDEISAQAYGGAFHGGFEFVYWEEEPTCEDPGVGWFHCSVCGLREKLYVPPLYHGMYWDGTVASLNNLYGYWSSGLALNDNGALTFVRNKIVDCYTQTQEWKCSICGETIQGLWSVYSEPERAYDFDTHSWSTSEVKYHRFQWGATRELESHVFDKDFIIELGKDKKYVVDLTSQSILDLFNAFGADLISSNSSSGAQGGAQGGPRLDGADNSEPTAGAPGEAGGAAGGDAKKVELNKTNLATFTDLLVQYAEDEENGIQGLLEIMMPTCEDPGYILVECMYFDDNERHEEGELEFSDADKPDGEGQATVKFDEKSGSYIIVEGAKDSKGKWSWGKDASATKMYKVYTIPAYGHTYGEWNTYYVPNQDGNGNLNGYWERVCKICGYVDSRIDTVAPAPCDELGRSHSYVVLDTVASTCVEAGKTTYICEVCGDTYEIALPKAAHTPVAVPEVPATEETPGISAGVKCSVCGEVLEGCEVIEPVVENVYAVNTSDIKIEGNDVSGSGKIEKTEGNQPEGKKYVYIVVNYERADGSTWAVAGTYPVDEDGSFDIPTITGITDTLTGVLVVAVDSKVGADWAGHNIAPAAKV